jgi:O-antigen/teichoic acid export membrane protein
MGIIQRQSVKSSLVNFTGFLVGSLSTLFIFPLDWELYGSIQYWLAIAMLLSPFLNLGTFALVERYFPYFKERKIPGFLRFIFVVALIATLFSLVTLFIFGGFLVKLLAPIMELTASFDENVFIVSLGVLIGFINLLRVQSANFQRIVFFDIVYKLGFKFFLPLVFLLHLWHLIQVGELQVGLIIFYLLVFITLIFYLRKIGAWDIKSNQALQIAKTKKKEYSSYMFFSMFNEVSHLMAYKIDIIMIGALLSKTAAGIFSSFLFLAAILEIPARSVYGISAPFIAASFEKNDMVKVEELYKKSSINLMIVGVFLFCIIWLNIENVFDIMTNGKDLRPYKWIFVFLGIAKLIDMMTSLNKHILVYSKYYMFNLYFVILLAILNIIANYIMIGSWGILGAGLATAISIFVFQLGRTLFIYLKLGVHPFNRKTMQLLIVIGLVLVISYFVHQLPFNLFLQGGVVSILFSALYFAILRKLKISDEIENMLISKLPFLKTVLGRD